MSDQEKTRIWEERLQEWEASGLRVGVWCKQQNKYILFRAADHRSGEPIEASPVYKPSARSFVAQNSSFTQLTEQIMPKLRPNEDENENENSVPELAFSGI